VTTHVSHVSGGLVRQALVVLWNWEAIHVSSQRDGLDVILARWPSALDIHNKPSPCAVLDLLLLDSESKESLSELFLGPEFFEAILRM
jgi:Mlc titration factor MtfA (ptsG expression regulator)